METKKINKIAAVQKQYHDATVAFAEKVKSVYTDHDFESGHDIDKAFREMPSVHSAMRGLKATVHKAIDDMPLTVAERDELTAVAKKAEDEAWTVMRKACNNASASLEEKAKRVAIDQKLFKFTFRNLPSSAKEQIYTEAWNIAYERGHSEGFRAVMDEFGEIMDFAEKVVEATVAKGGEA